MQTAIYFVITFLWFASSCSAVADEALVKNPTKAEYIAAVKRQVAARVKALDLQAKDIRAGKTTPPPGQTKKAALSGIMQEKAALMASLDLSQKIKPVVGSMGDPREISGPLRVRRIIDGNTMIADFSVRGEDREIIVRGISTAGLSDDAVVGLPHFAAFTGTERDDSGTTRLIMQSLER